ncbi:hypothetical protein M406DRAFT_67026 [Cryphonectria parasitica EP155]|uniref:N-acetyltransferase domain-containing protein n=1 Tax=Cryphonectria parasitica (strain ATCC 38755 / EP155) TaxID=660469 RepID=A0A9P4YDH3_CRYP1|nr:uncharacterized protein M406DRAFT_67026 [Cryphonectria parasitica EP155]KAF3770640.1 hypothetical protein M406DRAFT_67026 [Cryphonectria parasitica EP155]
MSASSPSSGLHIRRAHKADIPTLVKISSEAFRGRPLTEALFPPHLSKGLDQEEKLAFRRAWHENGFDNENRHYIVVVDGPDDSNIVGSACWQSRDDPLESQLMPEQLRAQCPPTMDLAALDIIERDTKVLKKNLLDALGEEAYKNSWYLAAISVDPAQQRRGIGRMLMDWGEERAAKEHKNIRLMASAAGAKLYRALGYEEVGAVECLGGMEYAFIKKAA